MTVLIHVKATFLCVSCSFIQDYFCSSSLKSPQSLVAAGSQRWLLATFLSLLCVARDELLTAAAYIHCVSFPCTHTRTHMKCCFFIPKPISHTALEKLDDVSVWFHHRGVLKKNPPSWWMRGKRCCNAFERNPCKFPAFSKSYDDKHGSAGARDGLKFKGR